MARHYVRVRAVLAALSVLVLVPGVAIAQSGYQTIQGTQVFIQIDQGAGVATFSNDCGSQSLSQSQLQNGAIPNNIIPCPRPSAAPPPPPPKQPRYNSSGADSAPPAGYRSPAPAPVKRPNPKMVVDQNDCKQYSNNLETCESRMRTAASDQATFFRDCIALYCKLLSQKGCSVSSVCRGGPQPVAGSHGCVPKPGEHLIFPQGANGPAECKPNVPGDPKGGPGPDKSDVTGLGRH